MQDKHSILSYINIIEKKRMSQLGFASTDSITSVTMNIQKYPSKAENNVLIKI